MKNQTTNGFETTLNQMGYMSTSLDPYSEEFVQYAATTDCPVLEIGAAYGVATIAALEKGADVVVNDLDSRHLQILKDRVPESLHSKLQLVPGRFPDELIFSDESFGAILACRILHLIPPSKLLLSVPLLFRWLKPGGKLFVIAETPYLKFTESFIPLYKERKRKGHEWPGYIEDTTQFLSSRQSDIPKTVNFLDVDVLARIFDSSGFKIEKVNYIPRLDFPEDVRLDGRESVGIILSKP